MKTTTSKKKIDQAKALIRFIQARKEAEKVEKELKSYWKIELKTDGAINAGGILITVEDCTRSSIDTKTLAAEMGAEFVKKYTKITEFQKVSAKAV